VITEEEINGTRVIEAEGSLTLSRVKITDGAKVTIFAGDVVAWAGQVPGEYEPDGVAHRGEEVWVRAAPLGRGAGSYAVLFYSPDGGNTFETIKARGGSDTNRVGFGPDGALYHLDQGRRLNAWSR